MLIKNTGFVGFWLKVIFLPLDLTHQYIQIMDTILSKMNFKEGMKIRIWNGPDEQAFLFATWKKSGYVAADDEKPSFMIAFVQSEDEVATYFPKINSFAVGDEVVWMAYPKGTSKKYKSKINRDAEWKALRDSGFDTVRQIAIDAEWSALRFRKVQYIKSSTRI
jgi:hypothetical protein